MDDNVMRVLQMVQDGKISAKEAEALIAALRGETPQPEPEPEVESKEAEEKAESHGFKAPRFNFDDLGERISRAVSKVKPDKILQRVQSQIRNVGRTGAHLGAEVAARVRAWTDGVDERPVADKSHHTLSSTTTQELHLENDAAVMIENTLGNVTIVGIEEGSSSVTVSKAVWGFDEIEAKALTEKVEILQQSTDSRLEINVSAPEFFRSGTVDLEVKVPASSNIRVNTRFGQVEVSACSGRVEVVTTIGDVHLHKLLGDVRGETQKGKFEIQEVGGNVTLATQSGDVVVDTVGHGLTVNSVSGQIHLKNVHGETIACKSVSGDVVAEMLDEENPQEINLESISGCVKLTQANGNIALKAVSGDIDAKEVVASRLVAQTVSGNVEVRVKEAFAGMMQATTVSGNVAIGLPSGSNVRLTLSSSSGELNCDHEASEVNSTDTLWTGQLGTGAGTLTVQTLSGDVAIE